ncbi:folylpolyglutamate synthase [Dissophora globulifera]|uniref:Folylpolyglutamate synthase n=1 Tax=Dissophora globulifera TaxID=979702 RepID=A0A9P6UQ51_9FUNG|nr:folylpolyglutamate synthase [Dissophora globulifera]
MPRDTIQINNQPISEIDYQYATDIVRQKDAELGLKATSFELLTATAFYWFAYGRQHATDLQGPAVDIAVIEVGLGGRLDATNIVPHPKVCVIASLGMDHGALLGNTIEQIAFEKAGIIKPAVPVVIAPQSEGQKVYKVLEDKATSVGLGTSQIIKVEAARWIDPKEALTHASTLSSATATTGQWATLENGYQFWIPLLGDFQLENAAAAIAAINVLRSTASDGDREWSTKITDDTIRQGIRNTIWPGRLQWLETANAPREVRGRMLLDGAHNPAAAIKLRSFLDKLKGSLSDSITQSGSRPRIHWIMAFTRGKDIEEMFEILFSKSKEDTGVGSKESEGGDTFSAVEFSPPEGMPWVSPIPAQEVCERLRQQQEQDHKQKRMEVQGFGADLRAALEWVGNQRGQDDVVVLCGSLYLVADLLRL